MQTSLAAALVSVPGFTDHHAHLLRDAAGVVFPTTGAGAQGTSLQRRLARAVLSQVG